jgi:small subunit ribosomal protein S8
MLNDPLANVFSKMQNALLRSKQEITITPVSDLIVRTLKLLESAGYIGSFEVIKDARGNYCVIRNFSKINKCGVIKPRYDFSVDESYEYEQRFLPAKDFGIVIVSTSKGLMTMAQAREHKLGGKLIAYCY